MISMLFWNDVVILNKSAQIPSGFKKFAKIRTVPMTHPTKFEEKVLESLQRIEERLGIIEKDCSTMRSHIKFIENTYVIVRGPLQYLKSRLDCITGVETQSLPSIEDDKK
jgi:hypothetical protein